MSYYFSKIVPFTFEETVTKVTEELRKEGFGILTEIDVKATMKKKLDVDFRDYNILGACNPHFAYKALVAEDKIGILLPCNVIVQENPEGEIEVSAVDPMVSMEAVENLTLKDVAIEVRKKLKKAIDNL